MERLSFTGAKDDLILQLENYMTRSDAYKLIQCIDNYQSLLEKDEYFTKTIIIPKSIPGMMQFIIPKTNYNVNVKACTIVILALLLDIEINFPVGSALLAIKGINGQALVKLDEYHAEKCVVMEILRDNKRTGNVNMFSDNNGECVNNNLNCMYNDKGKCTINSEQLLKVLDSLDKKNVVRKDGINYLYNL